MGQKPTSRRDRDPPRRPPEKQEFFKVLAVCCLLLLMVLLVFGQTVRHEFIVCDDDVYIRNRYVSPGLTSGGVWWSLTASHAGNWHPLTWLSHMFDVQCYGTSAGGHHLTGVLLHAASAIVLFLALRQMSGAFWCSALVAAMFALHPLRTESVAWAAERKDVLSGLFWMLTMLAYGWYARRPDAGRYLAVVGLFGLGLMAKSMLVTLPCLLLLLDFWPLQRWRPGWLSPQPAVQTPTRFPPRSMAWLVAEKLPLFALSAMVGAIVAISQRQAGAMSMVNPVPFGIRIANAAVSYVAYLWKTVWPANLAIFYPHTAVVGTGSTSHLIWQAILAGMALAAITLLVIWNLRRRPYLAVGWFWYLGTLVPVIGLVHIGAHSMADRYTYLPTIGIYVMAVWGAADLAAPRGRFRAAPWVAAAALLATWTVLAFNQTAHWKNSFTVFEHAIQVTNDNYFAHTHLGLAYQKAGNLEAAGAQYKKAVDIAPSYDAANADLGVYYVYSGQLDKALGYFKNAVRINPFLGSHHGNLGATYLNMGRPDKAVVVLRRAIELQPDNPTIRNNLSRALHRQGKVSEALAERREVIHLCPNDVFILNDTAWLLATHPDASIRNGVEAVEFARRAVELSNGQDQQAAALRTLAAAYAEAGQFSEAVQTGRKAIKLCPNDIFLLNNTAWLLATHPDASIRNGAEAMELARRAVELSNSQDLEAKALNTLAAAYAETGQFPEAVQTARQAMKLAAQRNKPALVKSIKAKIPLYEAGTPFRQPQFSPAATK